MIERMESMETVKKRPSFFSIGPSAVLMSFALSLTDVVFTDLIVYRTCLVSLNMNSSDCLVLRTNAGNLEAIKSESQTQPYASMVLMTKSLIQGIIPAVLSLFLGSWSDRGGRRPLLLAVFTGFTLMHLSNSLMSNWNISPWYHLCSSIPVIVVGGYGTAIASSICYVSDTTSEKERMPQLALLEASVSGGELLGSLVGPLIYKHYGYPSVFRAAAIACTLALVQIYFCVPETVKNASKESIRGLFRVSLIKDLVTSSFAKRDGFNRSVIWLGIPITTLCALLLKENVVVGFLFTRVRLGWNVQDYFHFSSFNVALRIASLCALSKLSGIFGIPDTLVAAVALLTGLSGVIAKSLAWQSWHMYFSVCLEISSIAIGPVMRSMISKLVPTQDIGKIFALMTFLEESSPLIGDPLFMLIFSNYLPPIYPSPVYLISITVYALSILGLICIHVLLRKSSKLSDYIPASQDDR